MLIVAIVGNGPENHVPNLHSFIEKVDVWIGADRGAYLLAEQQMPIDYAVGDFDSVSEDEKALIDDRVRDISIFPSMKNETDLEIALEKAYGLRPDKIYLFGVTGGRLDHGLANIQLLLPILERGIEGIIVDQWNTVTLTKAGTHEILADNTYPYVSLIPLSETVKNIRLKGFVYELDGLTISLGSTRCISNEIFEKKAIVAYDEGMLFVIKSKDID